jgi:hypothetical protein
MALACLSAALTVGGLGCSTAMFNDEFVELFDAEGTGQFASVDNATGHVPVIFVNRLQYSPQLVTYLEALNEERRLSGVPDTVTDLSTLRPRVRMRVTVAFENGEIAEYEFIDGDGVFEIELREEEEEDLGIPITPVDPNLTANTLSRLVCACDVLAVTILLDPQVFVPVNVRTIRVEVGDLAQQTRTLVVTDTPQFRPILPDEVDENLNTTLARNYGVREAPAPAIDITCGSMVGIVLSGVVSIPFTRPEDNPEDEFIAQRDRVPGFVDTDIPAEASIPGRFEFLISVR